MSDSAAHQPRRLTRQLWHGVFGALIGSLLGMVLAGSLHAYLVSGFLIGAGVGFLTGFFKHSTWLVLLVAASIVLAVVKLAVYPGRDFDPILWSDTAQIESGVRLGMADRLLSDGVLVGRTRAEVVAMLGEPPPTGYFAEWDLVYWLGPERGYISIDSEWLVARLGSDGRVTEARLVRD